jgi:hypothetical protein
MLYVLQLSSNKYPRPLRSQLLVRLVRLIRHVDHVAWSVDKEKQLWLTGVKKHLSFDSTIQN